MMYGYLDRDLLKWCLQYRGGPGVYALANGCG
jgi:hypothetical protein